jgi:hypothetical protein
MEKRMTTTTLPIESKRNTPSNVIPLWPLEGAPRRPGSRSYRSRGIQAHPTEANAVAQEPHEQRLARRIERVLCALLYHAVLQPETFRDSKSFAVEMRVGQLVSRERLMAVARAAITLDWTADLTRLAAVAIMFELQAQSRWQARMLRPFSPHRRQIHADTVAIARLLAWDLDALKVRPIDKFAKHL